MVVIGKVGNVFNTIASTNFETYEDTHLTFITLLYGLGDAFCYQYISSPYCSIISPFNSS